MIPPIAYNYHHLPYGELPPDIFEKLCLRLLTAKYGQENCSFYGMPGQNQHGFDIYVREEFFYDLYQCKRVLKFNSSSLREAIELWENGSWASRTRKFIIISSCSLEETSFLEEFEKQKKRLSLQGVILGKIGSSDLDQELKKQPEIVSEFFGNEWVKEFCSTESAKKFLQKLESRGTVSKILYPSVPYYIDRRVFASEKKTDIWANKRFTLLKYIESKATELKPARIILKAEAAVGKSKELDNLAYVFSSQDLELLPILIKLRNFQGEDLEKYIDRFFPNWKQIPDEKALFLFDGIDEVEAPMLPDFTKKFNLFLQSHSKSNIVASIRTNVFTKEIGNGIDEDNRLTEMYLESLNEWDIAEYLQRRLPTETKRIRFSELTSNKWMRELLLNPFYLSGITDLFLEDENNLPKTKPDIIKSLILHKISNDKIKYGSDLPLGELNKFARVVALFLTLTGKNSLEKQDVKSLTTISLQDLKKFSLFKVQESIDGFSLYFEHNNFQEFLAASELVKLKWERLKEILFHTKGTVVLKPKMVNTASFLFSMLPTGSSSFQLLLDTIKNSQQSLLLNFEKDKLDHVSRQYIFRNIIMKGKEDKIFFLRDDVSALELVQFTNYSIEALKFLLNELNEINNSNYTYCILELIIFFPPEFSDTHLNVKLSKLLCKLIKTEGYEYAVYDIAIDILTKFEIFSMRILNTIKHCPLIDDKMVRAAAVKYIDRAKLNGEFKYVLQSAPVLGKHGVFAALEDQYLRYILKNINEDNAIEVLTYWANNVDEIEDFLKHSFLSEDNRLIDKVYDKIAKILAGRKDKKLLNAAIEFLLKVDYRDYKSKEWGKPGILFSKIKNKQDYFWDIFLLDDPSAFAFLLEDFYNPCFAPSIIEKYRDGSINRWHLLTLRRSLNKTYHDEFHALLLKEFPGEFEYQEQVNWDEINRNREMKNVSLLTDRDTFLAEAEKVLNILSEFGKGDSEAVIELQYSEKKEILNKLDNTIILDVILDYKIKGGYEEFSKHFLNEKGWNWFVFQYVHQYINRKKSHLLPQWLIKCAQDYLNKYILPEVDFMKAITEKKEGSFSINNFALIIVDFFRFDQSMFSDVVVVKLLHMDLSRFYHYPDGEDNNEKKRLFELIYQRIGREKFVEEVLANLKSAKLPQIVKESHIYCCRFYAITESLAILKNLLTSRNTTLRTKEEIAATIIELTANPGIFDSLIINWKNIRHQWQLDICKRLYQVDSYKNTITRLIERSLKSHSGEGTGLVSNSQLVLLGLELGSFNVFDGMIKILKAEKMSSGFQIKSSTFNALAEQDSLRLIEGCFELLRMQAPTFVEDRFSSRSEVLEEVIRNAVADSEYLFELVLNNYERIIEDHIDKNPRISYFRWFEKRLIKTYYSKASRFDSDEGALELISELQLIA